MQNAIDVGLVGATPNGAENLGLQYLATSLKGVKHRPRLVSFYGFRDLERAVDEIIAFDPPLLGVSILSGVAAIDALAFILRVRQRGYAGHLTCGGPFATLCRTMLLQKYPQIDSIIRYDGEEPIRLLANAIANDTSNIKLPGVSTRAGDGLPAPLSHRASLDIRPERPRRKRYAGVLSAQVSAVRGCWGNCSYCGLAALRKEAIEEGMRCGMSPEELADAGVGGLRRRPIVAVAEEMADLYHRQGVRFFHFTDENHLPRESGQARRVIEELTDELDKRGVRKRAVNLMLRADAATDEVIDALDRLGLVRCLLGVESTSEQGLRALGRKYSPKVNISATQRLAKRAVMFHFNVLLIHPDSTIDSIDREIEGLSEVRGGLIDPFQVEVYKGTRVFEKLAREGRLLGGPLLFHFWPEEVGARRFSEIFYRLKRDAFGFLHLTAFAYEVLGAFAVARKLGLIARHSARLGRRAIELIEEHNALWIDLLRRISALSRASVDSAEVERFIAQTQIRSALLTLSFNEFKQTLEREATQPLTSDIFYPRTAAAVAVAVALLGTNACSKSVRPPTTDAGIISGNNDSEFEQRDSGRDAGPITYRDSGADSRVYLDANSCTRTVADHEDLVASNRVTEACYREGSGYDCTLTSASDSANGYWTTARLILDEEGYVTDIQGDGSDRDLFTPELRSCYLEALKGQRFPCLAEEKRYWINCGVILM